MKPLRSTTATLPLFPLPAYYLFPGVVAPLHIFETRYRRMVADLMDGPGRFVLTAYNTDAPAGDFGPRTLPIGTMAEILRHDQLDDGRYLMLIAALSRVRLREVDSEHLYRLVDVDVVDDSDPAAVCTPPLRAALLKALTRRTVGDEEAPPEVTTGRLADLLLHALELDPSRKTLAYVETDPLTRARLALAWHEEAPPAAADGAGSADHPVD
ncbi:hypothetical protein DRQ50_06890 [bacterium]|nr:MAG: hypothetical protein DRQ50_06890 [bacterium]